LRPNGNRRAANGTTCVAMSESKSDSQAGYDCVAEHYAAEYSDELKQKPFDCDLLDKFADSVRGKGIVCELGCGPGQVARYLKDRGVDVHGVDLSQEMVNVASRLNPDISFSQGDMLALEIEEGSVAAIVLFYSIIHIAREEVKRAFEEMKRVLVSGGTLFLSFHGGDGELHRDEWFGQTVSIDFRLFQPDEMAVYLEQAGFENIKTHKREPYDFEYPTKRIYMFANKLQ
jgi:SAM-dependent methyltransferase